VQPWRLEVDMMCGCSPPFAVVLASADAVCYGACTSIINTRPFHRFSEPLFMPSFDEVVLHSLSGQVVERSQWERHREPRPWLHRRFAAHGWQAQ